MSLAGRLCGEPFEVESGEADFLVGVGGAGFVEQSDRGAVGQDCQRGIGAGAGVDLAGLAKRQERPLGRHDQRGDAIDIDVVDAADNRSCCAKKGSAAQAPRDAASRMATVRQKLDVVLMG